MGDTAEGCEVGPYLRQKLESGREKGVGEREGKIGQSRLCLPLKAACNQTTIKFSVYQELVMTSYGFLDGQILALVLLESSLH